MFSVRTVRCRVCSRGCRTPPYSEARPKLQRLGWKHPHEFVGVVAPECGYRHLPICTGLSAGSYLDSSPRLDGHSLRLGANQGPEDQAKAQNPDLSPDPRLTILSRLVALPRPDVCPCPPGYSSTANAGDWPRSALAASRAGGRKIPYRYARCHVSVYRAKIVQQFRCPTHITYHPEFAVQDFYAVGLNRPTVERVRFMEAINHSVRCFD